MRPDSQTEHWVGAARQGDRLALTKLLAAYHPWLRARAAAHMGPALKTRCGPEDILQEVYLQVVRQFERFEDRGPGSFLKWVTVILDHKLIDALRAAHCQARDIDREVPADIGANADSYWNLLDQVYTDSGTPSRIVRRREALGALAACISNLPPAERQVVQWRLVEGLPVGEVARRLGKSDAAVVTLTQRALKALRAAMDRKGEFTRGA